MNTKIFANKAPIVIKIHVADAKDGKIAWIDGEIAPEGGMTKPEIYEFTFRWPNWKDDVIIQGEALEVVGRTVRLNAALLRFKRFQQLIQSWNLTDEQGASLPVTLENIAEIDPEIGNTIMDHLDRVLGKF